MAGPLRSYNFVAISIAGIGEEGNPSSLQSNGWLFATDGVIPHGDLLTTSTEWDYRPTLRADNLKGTDDTTNPFTAKTRWSRFGFSIKATDEMAERLLFSQRRAVATLQERITASASTLKLDDSSYADNILYLGDETLRLGSATGTSGGVTTYDISDRGIYGSEARDHGAETNVFDETPYWDQRRVTLHTVEHSGGPDFQDDGTTASASLDIVERNQFRLNGAIVQNKGKLEIQCRAGNAGIKDVKRGRANRSVPPSTIEMAPDEALQNPSGYKPQVVKAGAASKAGGTVALEVDGEVVVAHAPDIDTSTTPDSYDGLTSVSSVPDDYFLGQEYPVEQTSQLFDDADEIVEVFGAEKSLGVTPLWELGNVSEFSNKFRWHPLSYYAAIHLSTTQEAADASEFDVLQPDWSLDLGRMYSDTIATDIADLIRATPTLQIDQEIIGTGGDAVQLRELSLRRHLAAWGFTEALDENGYITVKRAASPPDIEDFDNAKGNTVDAKPPSPLELDTGRGSMADVIQVSVGNTEISDGETIFVQARDNSSSRPADATQDPDLEIDLGTVTPGGNGQRFVQRLAADRAIIQHFAIPRIRILVDDHVGRSLDYGLGEPVLLDDLDIEPAWLVNKSGTRIQTISSDKQFTGVLIGRRFLPKRRAYELELMLSGEELARWRAPSGDIQSVDSTNNRIVLGGSSSDSAFGDTDDSGNVKKDASRFSVGDEIEIVNPDFSIWTDSTIREVTAVNTSGSDNSIDLDGWFNTDPPTTRFVRLAHLDSDSSGTGYQNDGLNGTFSNINLAYVYLADTSDTVGDTDKAADQYGA